MNVKILVIVSPAFENISAIYMTAKNYNHYLMNDSSGEMKNVLRIKSRYVIGIGKLLVTIAPKSLCQNVDVIDGTTINERVNDRRKIGKFIIGQSEITVFWQRLSTRRQHTFSYDVLMLLYRCTPRRFGAHFRILWFGINSYHIYWFAFDSARLIIWFSSRWFAFQIMPFQMNFTFDSSFSSADSFRSIAENAPFIKVEIVLKVWLIVQCSVHRTSYHFPCNFEHFSISLSQLKFDAI